MRGKAYIPMLSNFFRFDGLFSLTDDNLLNMSISVCTYCDYEVFHVGNFCSFPICTKSSMDSMASAQKWFACCMDNTASWKKTCVRENLPRRELTCRSWAQTV